MNWYHQRSPVIMFWIGPRIGAWYADYGAWIGDSPFSRCHQPCPRLPHFAPHLFKSVCISGELKNIELTTSVDVDLIWLVVWNMFYVSKFSYVGNNDPNISQLTNFVRMGWSHQPVIVLYLFVFCSQVLASTKPKKNANICQLISNGSQNNVNI